MSWLISGVVMTVTLFIAPIIAQLVHAPLSLTPPSRTSHSLLPQPRRPNLRRHKLYPLQPNKQSPPTLSPSLPFKTKTPFRHADASRRQHHSPPPRCHQRPHCSCRLRHAALHRQQQQHVILTRRLPPRLWRRRPHRPRPNFPPARQPQPPAGAGAGGVDDARRGACVLQPPMQCVMIV